MLASGTAEERPDPAAVAAAAPVRLIGPSQRTAGLGLGAVVRHRELVRFLVVRELKIRYAQTVLGMLWMLFQPLGLMLVFIFAFRDLVATEPGVPYPVYALGGLTLWTFVSGTVLRGANSLVANGDLYLKASCPRLLIPLSTVLAGLADLAIGLLLLVGLSAGYGVLPTWRWVVVPAVVLHAVLLALGLSLFLAAVNVRFRDVRAGLPLVVQLWLFISPVGYPLRTQGQPWVTLVGLNPLTGIVQSFRWAATGGTAPGLTTLLGGLGVTAALLLIGIVHFARSERGFADET